MVDLVQIHTTVKLNNYFFANSNEVKVNTSQLHALAFSQL